MENVIPFPGTQLHGREDTIQNLVRDATVSNMESAVMVWIDETGGIFVVYGGEHRPYEMALWLDNAKDILEDAEEEWCSD